MNNHKRKKKLHSFYTFRRKRNGLKFVEVLFPTVVLTAEML